MSPKDRPSDRRKRLAEEMRRRDLDVAVISHPKHIFYLTGFPTNLNMWFSIMKGPRTTSFLTVDAEGKGSLLIGMTEVVNPFKADQAGEEVSKVFDGETSVYVDYSLKKTMVAYGDSVASELKKWLGGMRRRPRTIGVEEWNLAGAYREALLRAFPAAKLSPVSEVLLAMRNSKGKDEVENAAKATRMVDAAYAVAKGNAVAGRNELDIYAEVNAHSFREYGPFGWVVGDYASGERGLDVGGLPTGRRLRKGDTVVLDLQAAHNNYWSDLCRTFVVGRRPSKEQERALSTLKEAKAAAESILRPGTKGRDVYTSVNDVLTKAGYQKLPHHAGHGIGLDDQEPPWFIPAENRRLEEGSLCVVEPGVYTKETGGMRIEDLYVITRQGPRRVSRFPLGLA